MRMSALRRTVAYGCVVGSMLALPATSSAQMAQDYRLPPTFEWPVVGGDWGNSRYSPLDQINTSNVRTLRGGWMERLNGSGFGPGFSQQAAPVIKDGVLYIPTGQQDVFALDARTGAINWEYNPDVNPRTPGNKAKRGVAVGEGMVFTTHVDLSPGGDSLAFLVALDLQTGKVRWKAEIGTDVPPYASKYSTAPPLYYNGLIYLGLAGGDGALRGRLSAYDAKNGTEVWRFYTVPAPGEFGSDTWEGDSWQTGGAAIWAQPSLDADLGLLYLNTGNAWPDYNGSSRAGDNLFTASVVALDAKTGAYRWHYQAVHHDIWDFDVPTPLVLFDQVYDGVRHKGLAAHAKQGWLYLLDRVTGQPLIPTPETPVPQDPRQKTSATQPIPSGDPTAVQCSDPLPGFVQGCMFTPFWNDGNIAQPSASADWAPGSFNPKTGFIYVTAGISTRVFRAGTEQIVDGRRVSNGTGRYGPLGSREYGILTAIDTRNGKAAWRKEMPGLDGFGSGTLTTAGGLVFHGEPTGEFMALDAETGEILWKFQTGFGADAPAATYMINGEQYVVIAAGGSRDGLNEARGDLVWAFKLGGRLMPLNAPPAPDPVITFDSVTTGASTPVKTDAVTIGYQWNATAAALGAKDDYAFAPKRVTVARGASVTWTNSGDQEHSATAQGGAWDTGLLKPGESASLTFDAAGTYIYYCLPHPWMLGQVIVQ
jgi:quinohemoprotein ethanol dehydrogenase